MAPLCPCWKVTWGRALKLIRLVNGQLSPDQAETAEDALLRSGGGSGRFGPATASDNAVGGRLPSLATSGSEGRQAVEVGGAGRGGGGTGACLGGEGALEVEWEGWTVVAPECTGPSVHSLSPPLPLPLSSQQCRWCGSEEPCWSSRGLPWGKGPGGRPNRMHPALARGELVQAGQQGTPPKCKPHNPNQSAAGGHPRSTLRFKGPSLRRRTSLPEAACTPLAW